MSRRSRPVETAVLLALPLAALLVGPALSSIGVGEGNHDALLLLDHRLTVVLAAGAGDPRHARAAPVLQLHRLPLTRVRRPVARIDDRVDDIAVVEGLARRAALVERVEHVREHVDVTELGDLVADGEEPAGRRLSLLRHVLAATA